jgi:hypothetical protein
MTEYKRNRDTYVYIIGAYDRAPPVKIGISNNPKRRLKELQCSSARKLYILWEGIVARPRVVEVTAHKLLESFRLEGEWFNVRAWQAIATLEDILAMQDTAIVAESISLHHTGLLRLESTNETAAETAA